MRGVSLVGAPGTGKTTIGRRLAEALGVRFVELDSIFHQPRWGQLLPEEFRERVGKTLSPGGWVVDGNYSAVRDLVWQKADTVVWLDLPRGVVMGRIIWRTLRRAVTRERLWNGNRQPLGDFYRLDPEKSIVRWAWVKHPEYRDRYGAAMHDPAFAHLRFIRLRSQREVDAFLGGVK